jgi:hypothetical protein
MDTVGTFEMALGLAKHKILTAVHKHYSVDQWKAFVEAHDDITPYLAVSSGISEDDFKKLEAIIASCAAVTMICLDVANGSVAPPFHRIRVCWISRAGCCSVLAGCGELLPMLHFCLL